MLTVAFFALPARAFAAPCPTSSGSAAAPGTDTTATGVMGWQKTPVTVTLAGGGSEFQYWVDCTTFVDHAHAGDPVLFNTEGTHTITHRAQDAFAPGVWSDWVQDTVRIDTQSPVNNTIAPSSAWMKGPATATVSWAAEGVDAAPVQAMWKIDSGSWNAGTAATVSAHGTYTLTTRVVDDAGNFDDHSSTVKIDTVAPRDDTAVPAGWQLNSAAITLDGFDADSDVATIDYQIDSGAVISKPDGYTINVTANGPHTLTTTVVDNAGNRSASKVQSFYVDSLGPADQTTVPTGWVVTAPSTLITVQGADSNGSGVARTEYKLTDMTTGAVQTGDVAGSDPVLVPVSGNGVHKLQTRLTDDRGHTSTGDTTSWLTQYVNIDNVKPTDTTNQVTGWVKQSTLNVNVSGMDAHSGVARVEWMVNGVFGSANAASQVVVMPEGVNTLETRVVDVAGNVSDWKPQTIRLDRTPPTNLTPTTSGWRNTPYSVPLSASDNGSGLAKLGWQVDSGAMTEGAPGTVTATVTGDGKHTLHTWAVDALGNTSTPRDDNVWIDTVKPTDATVYPSSPVGRGHKIVFNGNDADSGVASVEWTLDGGSLQTTASLKLLTAGTHTVATRIGDNAGNVSAGDVNGWVTHTIVVDASLAFEDTDKPVDTTAAPVGWQSAAYTLTITGEDIDGSGVDYMQWRIGDEVGQGPSGSTVQFATEGVHEIETRAVDKAGLASDWRLLVVKVDLTSPTDTTALPAASNSATFTLAAHDATSGPARFEYRLDGGSAVSVPVTSDSDGNASVTVPLPAGDRKYKISHRVVDGAERSSQWKVDDFSVDTVAPFNTSAPAPTGWVPTLSLPLTGTDASGSVHGEFMVDTGNWQPGPAVITQDGTHTLRTRVVDAAGNASPTRTETVKVDGTPPVNTTPAPSAPWLQQSFTATLAGTDATSGVTQLQWTLDGAPQTGTNITVAAVGAHVLRTRVGDAAGNWSDWRVDPIGIDHGAPALAVNCGSDAWRAAPVTCAVTGDGGESGLSTLTVARNAGPEQGVVSGAGYTVAEDGDYTLTIRAKDGAGNTAATTAHVRVDRTAPSAGLDCAADAGSAYTCRASGGDAASGLASLTYSVDGGAPVAVPAGSAFPVAKGRVVVRAVDAAGNAASSRALIRSDRIVPFVPKPRETSEAVLRSGRGSATARAVGEIALSGTAGRSSVDLRPLAVGKGRFQITMKLRADKKRKTYSKVVTAAHGYTPRISVRMGGAVRVTVDLTIRRRLGKRWVAYASGGAEL